MGLPEKILLPNHAGEIHLKYDHKGIPSQLETSHLKEEVQRDCLDNPTKLRLMDPLGRIENSYSYDDLNQLVKETGFFTHTYLNDSLYNCVQKDDHLNTHSSLNQLLKDHNGIYNYDPNGNRTSSETKNGIVHYVYDAQDRLVSYEQDGRQVTYTYDEANRRLTKTYEGKTIKYFYAGMMELGAVENENIIELKLEGALELNGELYISLHNHLGHIACLLDSQGEVFETYRYSAFGEELIFDKEGQRLEDSINPRRYAGKRHDSESGLIYFGLRYYDPHTATWLTPDPIGQEGGPNLYAYVLNNPLRYFDRFGLSPEVDDWLGYEVDRLSGEIAGRENSRIDILNAVRGTCHGVADFIVGNAHDWELVSACFGASDLDFEDRVQIINSIQMSQAERVRNLDNWITDKLSIDSSNSNYRSFRSKTHVGLEVGSLVAGGYGLIKGIISFPRLTRSFFRISKLSHRIERGGVTLSRGAENVNAFAALRSKLSQLQDAQQSFVKVRILNDGRIRYYDLERKAATLGKIRGRSYVTEFNPKTGLTRTWMECYDQTGQVNRVHPKQINGQEVISRHYPPTEKELGL